MKKACGPSLEGQVLIAPRNDSGKRIYRAISEAARRIDLSRLNATSVSILFESQIEIQRIKLRDSCEKLLFAEPLLFGRKSQELLWRKSYYDVIYTAKKLINKNDKTLDILLLHNHIDSGIGYYNYFLLRLQNEFNIDLKGVIDFPMMVDITSKLHLSNEVKKWAYLCAHSCLISLGDLCRYKIELDLAWDSQIAANYYKKAVYLDSRIGMPYNQLGTLSGTINYNLDAIYYYVQCLLTPQPFDGAENNLKIIFEKNRTYVNALKTEECEDDYTENIKKCISRFLYLFEIWIFNKTEENINNLCHAAVSDFRECILYMEPPADNYDEISDIHVLLQKQNIKMHPEYMDGEIIFKISVMCIMCVQKLQDINSSHVSLVKAFTLAIFLELIDFVIGNINDYIHDKEMSKIENSLHNLEIPCSLNSSLQEPFTNNEATNTIKSDISNSKQTILHNKKLDKIEPVKKNCRRRRRRHFSDSSANDSFSSESEDLNGFCSESSLSDCIDITSDEDTEPDMIIEHIEELNSSVEVCSEEIKPLKHANHTCANKNSSFDIKQGNHLIENISERSKNRRKLKPEEILNIVETENCLQSIKILCDWLRGDIDLIKSCAQNSPNFLQRLMYLLNLINLDLFSKHYKEKYGNKVCVEGINFDTETLRQLNEKIPISEDLELRGLSVLRASHEVLDWQYHKSSSSREECLLRALKLVNFGFFISKIKSTYIEFNSKSRFFVLKKMTKSKHGKKKIGRISKRYRKSSLNYKTDDDEFPNNQDTDTTKSKDLMSHMGRLWLKARVTDLESRVKRSSSPTFHLSPFIVIDTQALIHHTHKVRQLVIAKKSIILIPNVVLSALDLLKHECTQARDAIRWLEGQFHRGNRYLRAQRPNEQLAIPRVQLPKKLDRDSYNYIQIIEFCHYIISQKSTLAENNDKKEKTCPVTLLTGPSLSEFSGKDFSVLGLAQSAGVNVEKVTVFYAKWKNSLKRKRGKFV